MLYKINSVNKVAKPTATGTDIVDTELQRFDVQYSIEHVPFIDSASMLLNGRSYTVSLVHPLAIYEPKM